MVIFFIFIFGLCIGSFLNAVIWRLHRKESFFKGRSYCPKCRHSLGARDLIPLLSFLLLKGKCRYCKEKISWQYPVVELATGLLFCLVYWQGIGYKDTLHLTPYTLYLLRDWFFISVLVVIFVYDLKYYLILDKVTIPAIVLAFIVNLLLKIPFTNLLLGGIIVSGFFLLQFLVSRGKWIGGGDIRLGFLMGVMLGWPKAIVALFLAYIIGALIGVMLIILKKKTWKSEIPFGTFLVVGTVITLLYGGQLLKWYLGLVK